MNGSRRYLLLSLAVLAGVALTLAGLLQWQGSRVTEALANDRLDTAVRAQRLVELQQRRDLETRAELIARNQAVVGYLAQALGAALPGTTIDRASIEDLLKERRGPLDLALIAVLDGDGQLVAATQDFADGAEFSRLPLFAATRKAQALQSGLWVQESRLLHIAILPLTVFGVSDAYLLVGIPVGYEFARTIAEIGATDVVLVAMMPRGPILFDSTLEAAQQAALLRSLRANAGSGRQRIAILLDGARHSASLEPLFGSEQGRLMALVSPGRDSSALEALRQPLIVGGALALLGALCWLLILWWRVLRPAEHLAGIVERGADGDRRLSARINGGRTIARLATAFNRLLAQF